MFMYEMDTCTLMFPFLSTMVEMSYFTIKGLYSNKCNNLADLKSV